MIWNAVSVACAAAVTVVPMIEPVLGRDVDIAGVAAGCQVAVSVVKSTSFLASQRLVARRW